MKSFLSAAIIFGILVSLSIIFGKLSDKYDKKSNYSDDKHDEIKCKVFGILALIFIVTTVVSIFVLARLGDATKTSIEEPVYSVSTKQKNSSKYNLSIYVQTENKDNYLLINNYVISDKTYLVTNYNYYNDIIDRVLYIEQNLAEELGLYKTIKLK